MEYRRLGRTGFEVSLLSLGSGGARVLGQALGYSQDQQTALVRRALDLGVNLIDTSSQYGDSEAILGRALYDGIITMPEALAAAGAEDAPGE